MTLRILSAVVSVQFLAALLATSAEAYTPETPKVRDAIERAAKYLEQATVSGDGDEAVGEAALVALALLKAERDLNHPRVQQVLKQCVGYAAKMPAEGEYSMYATAIVMIFLCEADSQRYKPQIDKLLSVIKRRQRAHGAWGYKEEPTKGDTSQSQYCILAYWEAYNHGFPVELNRAVGCAHWLIRTQDPSGSFGYKGHDSGRLGVRVRQSEMSHSLAAAGLGSLYIAMDMLGFEEEAPDDEESALPPDVKLVSEVEEANTKDNRGDGKHLVSPTIGQAVQFGNNWFRQNEKTEYGGEWQYYYMYALERYHTFRDKVENRKIAEPKWYNDGVDYLIKKQKSNGSWTSTGHGGPASTCFGVFFLTRSTQKTIGAILMNQGVLKGGKGFQKGELRSSNGKIVGVPLSRSVGDLLASIDEGSDDELADFAASVAQLEFDGDPSTRSRHQALLRGLVSHRSYHARLMAVKTLAKQRNMDNVPALIYALSDPDGRVAVEARDGLRFISRKINGFGLPKQPKKGEVAAATEKWKDWFLSVRPDGKLFN